MGDTSRPDAGIKGDGLIARAVDWVFGYDFFLSYNHGDGLRLPRRLKERLEQQGFRVFLDQTEYVAGADLRRETRRQIVKSRKIVVVGRPGALRSEWVKREVDVALSDDKIPVILNVNGAVEAAPADAALAVLARESHWLRLNETLPDTDGEPSDRTISELVRGFDHTRQETKRQRIFGAAAAVLALTAAVATWQAVEATRAKKVAEAQRDRAQRVLDQVVGTANRRVQALTLRVQKQKEAAQAKAASPAPASETAAADALPTLGRANELTAKAAALMARGEAQEARGPLTAALQVLETRPDDPEWQLARFKVYDRLAEAALARGEAEAALAALGSALALADRRLAADPSSADWRRRRAALRQRLGTLYLKQGRVAEAEQHYRAASDEWGELARDASEGRAGERGLAVATAHLGDLELARGNSEAALAQYKKSLALLEQLLAADEGNTGLQRDLSVGYQQIADALIAGGKPEDALHWADKDIALTQAIVVAADAAPDRQRDLASSYDRRARALDMLGRTDVALDAYSRGVNLLEAAIAADDTHPSWQRDAAAMLESRGKLLGRTGQADRAVRSFRRALSIREALAASLEEAGWQAEVEAAYRRASELMLSMGREAEAMETAEQYLLAVSVTTGRDDRRLERIGRALGTLCWSALNARSFSRALWAGRQAVELAPSLDWARLNYAHALMFSGERDKAREIYLAAAALPPEEAKKLKASILKDFDTLRQRRLEDSLMAEIGAHFGA